MTKQAFYKGLKARDRLEVDEEFVLELVRRERRVQPMLGARKLLWIIAPELKEAGVAMGRDRFLALLRREGLLIERKARSVRTTYSGHGLYVWPNLLKNLALSGPNQAWAADITYVRTLEGFVYVALLTDVWSRKIVGWDAGMTLEAEGAMRALTMALKQLPKDKACVHHSDRGTQYCCGDYVKKLHGRKVRISMTEANHCYENAKAERVNGILKQEYGLGETFRTREQVPGELRQAVGLYNARRPHTALALRTPQEVHDVAA
jgi:transposase InsO family protein